MEQQETQSPVQYAAESLDKQESNLLILQHKIKPIPKKNISSGEDAFVWEPLFKDMMYELS